MLHWCLGLCLEQGSALGSLGNGPFLGALAMPGLLDFDGLVDGAAFIGSAEAAP